MILDVFRQTGGAFSMQSLTAAINNAPFVPGRLGQLGIFNARGIPTTTAMVEQRDQKLYLVPNTSRGGPAKQNSAELRKGIPLPTAHLPVEDRLLADEIQNVRAFGSENQLEGVIQKVNEKLATMARSLDATLEYHRVGAINGKVLDADGSKVILDIFSAFGVSQQTEVDFDLDAASPADGAVRKKCSLVIRAIEDELGATPYSGIHCLCSAEFFDDLVEHPEVKAAVELLVAEDGLFWLAMHDFARIFGARVTVHTTELAFEHASRPRLPRQPTRAIRPTQLDAQARRRDRRVLPHGRKATSRTRA